MNQDQTNQSNLLDTTDCLEAMGVFRGWKNFLFIIMIFCLLVLQVSFWLIDTGCVEADTCAKIAPSAPASESIAEPNEAVLDKAAIEQEGFY